MNLRKRSLAPITILPMVFAILSLVSSGEPQLVELDSVDQLKEDFNRSTGQYRLILLLSPT